MKKLLFKTALLFMVGVLSTLTLNAQIVTTLKCPVSIYPSDPLSTDSIYIAYSYVSTDGCPDFYLSLDAVESHKLYVSRKKIDTSRSICTTVITNFTTKLNIGKVANNTSVYFDGVLMRIILFPCILDKTGIVVTGTGTCSEQLFIQEFSIAAIAIRQLYAIENNIINVDGSVSKPLKVGDKVKFGGYLLKAESTAIHPCGIVGVANCYEVIETATCVMDRKGKIVEFKDNHSLVMDAATGETFGIKDIKIPIGTILQFKGVKIQCITTPCYNIVECYQVISTPPPCVMDKKGVVVEGKNECAGQLYIQEYSPLAVMQLYVFDNTVLPALKAGDDVIFGSSLFRSDDAKIRPCYVVGVVNCYQLINATACVMDRKGKIVEFKDNHSLVMDAASGEVFGIRDVKIPVGTMLQFKGVKIQCITTPCYNIVECYQIISIPPPPPPCVMDKTGVVVAGIDGCTGRLFILENSASAAIFPRLYEIQNSVVAGSDGSTISKLKAGDKVKFGGYLTPNDSTKISLCFTVGVATCYELIATENTFTLSGKAMAGNEIMKSGLAVLFRKGDAKAIASNSITDGTFTFVNIPEAVYTVYVIPDINLYKNFLPTFYINKFLYNQADYLTLNKNRSDVVVYLTNINTPIGIGRIFGNIFFETEQLKDVVLAANGSTNAFTNTNRIAENTSVILFNTLNEPVAWTMTDTYGNYSFDNLALNTYKVVSETASAKAESIVNLSNENSAVNADLILTSVQDKTYVSRVEDVVLNFYPNPVADRLIVNVKENEQINIYNSVGQLLLSQSLFSGVNILDVSTITKGIYLAKIGNTTIKMIKK
ncbi:MAG: T9SS type A sorting domain-containing protein [Paludibacter sp.]|nr:T9SS type A sorting domain-containing protein [Paludibacter sp.]